MSAETKEKLREKIRAIYAQTPGHKKKTYWFLAPLSFFLVELFGASILIEGSGAADYWPLAFGLIWAGILSGILYGIPGKASRILYGITYFLALIYAGFQTGYYLLFQQMMWISDFRYASEGSDYISVLFQYPVMWWIGIFLLIGLGVFAILRYPRYEISKKRAGVSLTVAAACMVAAVYLPMAVFEQDRDVRFAGSDYGRAQSAEAAYHNMFNVHRLYQTCGLYQTAVKDISANMIAPHLPGEAQRLQKAWDEIDGYFSKRQPVQDNNMTGLLEGKNIVMVLMESMDDWAIGEHTPTISRLMQEGINFTNWYTPGYGGVRTFNSEFTMNTGSYLSSQGGYAFDYVTNHFQQSLPHQLKNLGYSAKVYHYNDPNFYSRGVFDPAMGYDEYVCYGDYVTEDTEDDLYDDQFLFNYPEVADSFFREGKKLNFIITRSAHLSYKYNEVLSYWGLKQYPEYRGLTGDEEEDCMYLKARLVDDMFTRLLSELEAHGELENTVIVAMTDHYSYGFKNVDLMKERSGVTEDLLLEKTPCFIWTPGIQPRTVTKTLQTADFLPTMLNLLAVDSPYPHMGHDAFDSRYPGYALFPDGSWVAGNYAYDAGEEQMIYLKEDAKALDPKFQDQMAEIAAEFVGINNQILETDYYKSFR